MSEAGFAPWVEPIAGGLARSRQDIEHTVRRIPAEAWAEPSGYPGWTYKDHLSHLPHAHSGLHDVLQAVVEGRTPDFSRYANIDALNEQNRQDRLETPVEDLIAAFARESEGTQRALASLTAEHAEVNFGPMTLSQALSGFAMHDLEHLEQMKKALQA
jgi:uncharacterized protein (TIGR03083 family)